MTLKMMLPITVAIIATLFWQVSALGEICDADADCNVANKERCQKFDGCKKGACVCTMDHWTWMQYGASPQGLSSNVCLRMLKVGASCTNTTGTCGKWVKCWQGTCECRSGDYETDGTGYNCVHKTTTDYVGDGGDCTGNTFKCKGGTNCKSNRCECPDHSTWNSVHKVCIHDKSETGLVEGDRCHTTIGSSNSWNSGYAGRPYQICATDMMCSVCPEDMYKSGYMKSACRKNPMNGAKMVAYNAILVIIMVVCAGGKSLF